MKILPGSRTGRLFLAVLTATALAAPGLYGRSRELPTVPPAVLKVHQDAVVADLHMDPLLWNEDLGVLSRSRHVDLPRLREGKVDIAIFGIVTAGLPIIGGWKPFTWWQGWKAGSTRTAWTAALDQIDRLDAAIARSGGLLVLTRDAAEVEKTIAQGHIAAMIGVEGAHALDGDITRVRTLHARGVLYMGPVHLSANTLGGSSFPVGRRGGLTDYGRQVVREMEAVGMWVDVAHLSEAAFWEVVRMTHGPILCSHTGIYGAERSWRNLKDDQLKAIADRGGVIGVMLAKNFLGGRHVGRWVDHVKHAVSVAGIDHVALGSDFDGFIRTPEEVPDVAALPQLTRALLEAGFSEADAGKIMGGNFLEMLKRFRPGSVPASAVEGAADGGGRPAATGDAAGSAL